MPRPTALEPAQLLKELTAVPRQPSELAFALKVSRATLHRKLETLLEEGLAVRVGEGPKAAYRLPTTEEQVLRSREGAPAESQVRLLMPAATAGAVESMMDLFCRIGLGQIREVASRARFGYIQHADGSQLSYDELDQADGLCDALTQHLLGFSPNASHGIYSPRVHSDVLMAWGLQRAIRFRGAWDRVPEGGMGVSHDEPLGRDSIPGLVVHSDRPNSEKVPQRFIVEMPRQCADVMARALRFSLQLETGDASVIVELAKAELVRQQDGEVASSDALAKGATLAGALSALLSGVPQGAYTAQLTKMQARALQVLKALEAFEATSELVQSSDEIMGDVEVAAVADSPWAVEVEALPPGYLLNYKGGEYRVIAPREDNTLVIMAGSRSLQTAIQMAKNLAKGQRARAFA